MKSSASTTIIPRLALPFEPAEHRRIAVKIVDDRGIKSLRIAEVS